MQVNYEITSDSNLLKEYYAVREKCYRQELALLSFDGSEEASDLQGHIFVVRKDTHCLGGTRILGKPYSVLASQSFSEVRRQLSLEPGKSCVWERLAVLKDYRMKFSQFDFCRHLVNASRALGYDYAFMVSSIRNARLYRQCHSVLGIPFKICPEVECAPDQAFENLEHVLSVADLRQPAINPMKDLDVRYCPAVGRSLYSGAAA